MACASANISCWPSRIVQIGERAPTSQPPPLAQVLRCSLLSCAGSSSQDRDRRGDTVLRRPRFDTLAKSVRAEKSQTHQDRNLSDMQSSLPAFRSKDHAVTPPAKTACHQSRCFAQPDQTFLAPASTVRASGPARTVE